MKHEIIGVVCPKCGYTKSYALVTRQHYDGIYRRRECEKCGERFTTYEFTDDMVRRIKDRAVKIGLEEGKMRRKKNVRRGTDE